MATCARSREESSPLCFRAMMTIDVKAFTASVLSEAEARHTATEGGGCTFPLWLR